MACPSRAWQGAYFPDAPYREIAVRRRSDVQRQIHLAFVELNSAVGGMHRQADLRITQRKVDQHGGDHAVCQELGTRDTHQAAPAGYRARHA